MIFELRVLKSRAPTGHAFLSSFVETTAFTGAGVVAIAAAPVKEKKEPKKETTEKEAKPKANPKKKKVR